MTQTKPHPSTFILLFLSTFILSPSLPVHGQTPPSAPAAYPTLAWKNGAWADPNFFPLAVWMQPVKSAKKFKDAGVNIYMALWDGPTETQLQTLADAHMAVMVNLNDVAVKHKTDPQLIAWLQEDEPDLAHSNANGWPELTARPEKDWNSAIGQYQPPINPKTIIAQYNLCKAVADKPVYVGLSFGFMYEYAGRANRKTHFEDYAQYIQGADIVGYDIYPGIHQYPPANAKYWTEAWGVKKLVDLANGQKIIWPTVEACAPRLDHSPKNYQAEVWMAIIHGAMGITYWVHQNPSGTGTLPAIEDSVFVDPAMAAAFTQTNHLITSLAPVLNSPPQKPGATVESSQPASKEVADAGLAPIALMTKKYQNATYVFAVRMEDSPAKGSFTLPNLPAKATAEVLNENRTIDLLNGKFTDDFQPLAVHIYRITAAN